MRITTSETTVQFHSHELRQSAVTGLHAAENLSWYRALSLTERLSAELPTNHPTTAEVEDESVRYRLQSWKSQPPFNQESYFAQRLSLDHLTELQWQQLLSEPLASLQARFPQPPVWLTELCAVAAPTEFSDFLTDQQADQPATGFLNAAAPFIEQAYARFEAGLAALLKTDAPLPFDPTTARQIFSADLAHNLLTMLSRTMVLELNVARLSGELVGATPEARFQNFIERLREPARLRALLEEYPVLARLLLEQTQRWVTVSLEFLTRLCQDWAELQQAFAPEHDPGVLVSVKGGLSDSHAGGRSVLIAKFSAGWRVVYKPKSLAVDTHFQALLRWLNARGAEPRFPALTVLERETYGWVEFVAARGCRTTAELKRFYQRQGGYLALLHLLDATDFHAGNVIACGEYPYLIDLEALFYPHRNATELEASATANRRARQALNHSLLRIGLLPERVWGNSAHEGVDQSGLGTAEGQLTPHALAHWEAEGTDTMHLVRKRKPIEPDKNRPQLAGKAVNVLDYQPEIQAGFAALYALLLKHKAELAAPDGPLAHFAQDEVCVFLRSMRTYRRLLRESYHPDLLRDALDRERHFDLLWVEVPGDPALARVIQLERTALLHGDMPQFSARPASRDLWINASECLPDFFAESSLSVVRRRLEQLGEEDYQRQAWVIRASLATLPQQFSEDATPQLARPTLTQPTNRAALCGAAQTIGERLANLSFRGSDDAAWLGLVEEREHCWEVEVLGLDLEGGLPGVALFLAYLGAVTKQPRYTALAEAALTTMQQHLREWGDDIGLIGGFDGWGGLLYTLTHLGALWQRPELIAEAEALVERLPELIAEDDAFDLHSGAAGCIAALRCLAQVIPADRVGRLTVAAIQCGDHLLAQAELTNATSFVRGTTGIAWALLKLHDWTGLERFHTAARKLLDDERGHSEAPTADWLGMCLARFDLLPLADNAALRADLAAALAATLSKGLGGNHALLNGAAGKLELLLQACRTLGVTEWEPYLHHGTAALLDSIEQQDWRCGTPLAVETPGLLAGLAGIGWQLLRLAEPELVPSVLLFEPPLMQYRQ